MILFFFNILLSEEIGPLIINEIFPFSGKYGEWLELKNRSNVRINLAGWQLADPTKIAVITYRDFYLSPSEIVLLVKDSTLFKSSTHKYIVPEKWIYLNNDLDTLKLNLPYSEIYSDYVCYNKKWFAEEKHSLKRYSFNNYALDESDWISSIPTPGYITSSDVNDSNTKQKNTLSIAPLVITPNGDGVDDFLKIYPISKPGNLITLSIYDFSGRLKFKRDILSGEQFYWEGQSNSGERVSRGPLFVVAEFNENNSVRKRFVLWR